MSSFLPWKLAYINVQGLTSQKLLEINSWISSSAFDLVCIAETWLIDRDSYAANPFFLTQSTLPTIHRRSGHQNGGLLLLCHPSLLPSITINSTSEYSISFSIHATKFACAYFPPQLQDSFITSNLHQLESPDVFLGDINVRLGSLSGDSTSSCPSRRTAITAWTASHHLNYMKNVNESISRTDHVFSRKPLSWTYHWNLPIKTDHGLMSLSINLIKHTTPMTPSTRYDVKPFFNNFFSLYFANYFEHYLAPQVLLETNATLELCLHSMILPSTHETQALIDSSYESLTSSIHQAMSIHLKTYDAKLVKSTSDKSMNLLPTASNVKIIRAFKRSNRSREASTPIESRDPQLSPLEDCHQHYKNLYACPDDPPAIERTNDLTFSLHFTSRLIKTAIRNYSNTKSIGLDNIHTLVLKSLTCSPSFLQCLVNLFQIFAATGLVPSKFSSCRLHLLLKNKNEPVAPKTRPIVLSSILRRIFERCVMKTWSSNPHKWMTLHPSQAGFRRGFNCHSQLLLSDEISRRDCRMSVFLDLSSAFDNLRWKMLDSLLTAISCPPSSHSLIMSLICKPASLELSVNQSNPVLLSTHKGVFQGGGISAFIFALYINPLARSLNVSAPPHRPLALLFADDVQLKPRNPHEAQRLLDICSEYVLTYSMTWNLSKCATVGPCPPLVLSNQNVPTATTYKYLGMIHTANGVDWLSTLQAALSKQKRLMTALSDKPWPSRVRLCIYRTFVRPLTDYSASLASIWADRAPSKRALVPQELASHHQTGLQFIFRVRSYSKVLDYLSGLGPVTHHLDNLRCGLARFLKNLDSSNPLLAAFRVYQLSSSSNFLLPFCLKSPYLKSFEVARANAPRQELRYATWASRKLRELLQNASRTSSLLSYIDPACLLPVNVSGFMDQPPAAFGKALSWRLNRCFLSRTCRCGRPFHRTHLSCLLFDDLEYTALCSSTAFLTALEASSSRLTPLDFLLNIGDYSLFHSLITQAQVRLDALPQISS